MVKSYFEESSASKDHREAQDLLAWYVTGRLDPDEQARVHSHVANCTECQRDVTFQQGIEQPPATSLDVEDGWARMRRMMSDERAEVVAPPVRSWRTAAARPVAWLGWGIAASLTLVLGAGLLPASFATAALDQKDAAYHVLGAAPAAPEGNVVVIFRPDATEAQMRGVLKAAHARLVDGPTAADAWVLATPPAERDAMLVLLKGRHEVVLAEPVDAAAR